MIRSPIDTQRAPVWPEIDQLGTNLDVGISANQNWYTTAKSLLEPLVALALLVPGLPLIGICWLLVKLSSRGPGFYSQTRLGLHGKPYRIIKIRTMRLDAEATGARWASKHDQRVTRVGQFLRKTHLDELPQLFNVLMGQMSLVGPRPERPEIVNAMNLEDRVPGYRLRLLVRPGVTGLAQVQLPADSDIKSVRHKIVYDIYYVQHATFWLDLRLVVATLFKAAGMPPLWLRRLFILPTRSAVGHAFLRSVSITKSADAPAAPVPELIPA